MQLNSNRIYIRFIRDPLIPDNARQPTSQSNQRRASCMVRYVASCTKKLNIFQSFL